MTATIDAPPEEQTQEPDTGEEREISVAEAFRAAREVHLAWARRVRQYALEAKRKSELQESGFSICSSGFQDFMQGCSLGPWSCDTTACTPEQLVSLPGDELGLNLWMYARAEDDGLLSRQAAIYREHKDDIRRHIIAYANAGNITHDHAHAELLRLGLRGIIRTRNLTLRMYGSVQGLREGITGTEVRDALREVLAGFSATEDGKARARTLDFEISFSNATVTDAT